MVLLHAQSKFFDNLANAAAKAPQVVIGSAAVLVIGLLENVSVKP